MKAVLITKLNDNGELTTIQRPLDEVIETLIKDKKYRQANKQLIDMNNNTQNRQYCLYASKLCLPAFPEETKLAALIKAIEDNEPETKVRSKAFDASLVIYTSDGTKYIVDLVVANAHILYLKSSKVLKGILYNAVNNAMSPDNFPVLLRQGVFMHR